ncbi:hypothetical protein ACS15_2991 [Ralstonia insidiosa]|uniref:Uncharacterized protein n=1 Tax=Ralstonia insidiosa TaxID=190721 RepID=A0AAC9FPQ5_9RALS|nr:hypothetical protein ACS15_2991 [Ralstonia insidiosa]
MVAGAGTIGRLAKFAIVNVLCRLAPVPPLILLHCPTLILRRRRSQNARPRQTSPPG